MLGFYGAPGHMTESAKRAFLNQLLRADVFWREKELLCIEQQHAGALALRYFHPGSETVTVVPFPTVLCT